jgi:methylation protein EvaC
MYKKYNHCRISESKNLITFFSFDTALAGGFLKDEGSCKTESKYPLTVSFCPESSLVQVNEVISPEVLFSDYFYKTGSINTLKIHFGEMANEYKSAKNNKNIVEIGCNDFSMLGNLIGTQYEKIIGVDPSNVAKNFQPDGTILYNTCFNSSLADKISSEHGTADIISASNCFAHIENIKDVTFGIKKLLSSEGVAIIEVHWLGNIIKNFQFPFIYHEHMYYYSLKAMKYLMDQFDLSIFDVKHIDIHGGSVRYYICHNGAYEIKDSVSSLEKEEIDLKLYDINTYLDYSDNVKSLGAELKSLISRLKSENKKIYGYGASGQANTLMAFYNINKSEIPLIIDDAPLKVGCFTPNNHIPIVNSEILNTDPPDYILCFAYTFIDEIIKRNKNFNGKWIIPLPEIKVYE